MKLQMNRLEHALGISSADSRNNQCKNRHRLLIVARKHNASAGCHSWRVSEAFTRWSRSFGLFCLALAGNIAAMSAIFARRHLEGKRIRPEKPVIKCGVFQYTSR
jgi:hypothetical protein